MTYGKVAPFYLIAVSNEVSTLILYTSLQEENDDENACHSLLKMMTLKFKEKVDEKVKYLVVLHINKIQV